MMSGPEEPSSSVAGDAPPITPAAAAAAADAHAPIPMLPDPHSKRRTLAQRAATKARSVCMDLAKQHRKVGPFRARDLMMRILIEEHVFLQRLLRSEDEQEYASVVEDMHTFMHEKQQAIQAIKHANDRLRLLHNVSRLQQRTKKPKAKTKRSSVNTC